MLTAAGVGFAAIALGVDVDSIPWASPAGLWARHSSHGAEAREEQVGRDYGG